MTNPPPELVTFVIQAQTEPFKDDPPYADDFYNAVGRMALMWGKLEQSLDNLVVTAIYIAKRTAPERKFFVALGRKLNLFRELYSECADLQPLEKTAHDLADEIGKLGDHRHMIIHSNWLGFEDGPPPKLRMRHLAHKKGNITISRVTPTIADLARLAGAFHGARSRVLGLLLATNERIDPEIWKRAQEQAPSGGGHFPPIEL
jgi:hypothetical protein